eukprot:3661381-Alexandrium_andersonii.AAC.1
MKRQGPHPRRGPRASAEPWQVISASVGPPATKHQHSIVAPVRSVSRYIAQCNCFQFPVPRCPGGIGTPSEERGA